MPYDRLKSFRMWGGVFRVGSGNDDACISNFGCITTIATNDAHYFSADLFGIL